ncbi:hypothetical protein ACFLVN_02330 [Chloroflexota bacterium]
MIARGEPGSGKTTIINYLYRYSSEMSVYRAKGNESIIVQCNQGYELYAEDGKTRLTLPEYITSEFTTQLHKIAEDNNFVFEDLYPGVRQDQLMKSLQKALTRMKSGESDFVRQSKLLLSLMMGQNFLSRLIKWFERRLPSKLITFIVDNLDCYTPEQRSECLRTANSLVRGHQNFALLIPLRFGTELDHRDEMHQYSHFPELIDIYTPPLKDILDRRLSRLPKGVIEGTFWRDFVSKLREGFIPSKSIALLNGLFGDDTREKLEIFRKGLNSPYLLVPEDYGNPDLFLRMIMLEENSVMIGNDFVVNLFNNEGQAGFRNSLVRPRILRYALDCAGCELNSTTIIEDLSKVYDRRILTNTINLLLRRGLLQIHGMPGVERIPDLTNEPQGCKIDVTDIGHYYMEELITNNTYLSICAQSSLIQEKFIRTIGRENVGELVRTAITQNELPKLIHKLQTEFGDELFISKENFLSFLLEQQDEEAKAFGADLPKAGGIIIRDNI